VQSVVAIRDVLPSQVSQRGVILVRLLSGQKRLSLGIVAVLGSLCLQELDEFVEDSGDGGA
jgi:hypothetical protein